MKLKRFLDVLIVVPCLLALSPLMLFIAGWIAAERSGPVLFRQTRVGQAGVPFTILKFRTMVSADRDQQQGASQLTVAGNARIKTMSGRVLRRSKLDELPQLLNVLRGDMSLVGPRPEVQRYVDQYAPQMADVVLGLKPGITGIASIAFRNEEQVLALSDDPERAYVEDVLPSKLRLEMFYARTRTIALDVKLLFVTLLVVILPTSIVLDRSEYFRRALAFSKDGVGSFDQSTAGQ